MPKIFLRYTAELAIWHAESRAAGDDEPTMVDVTDEAAIVEFPLDVHILIRDNWTGKCIAQRVAHGYDNRVLARIMGTRFAEYYQYAATHYVFTGVVDKHMPISGRRQRRLRRALPAPS